MGVLKSVLSDKTHNQKHDTFQIHQNSFFNVETYPLGWFELEGKIYMQKDLCLHD